MHPIPPLPVQIDHIYVGFRLSRCVTHRSYSGLVPFFVRQLVMSLRQSKRLCTR